MEKKEIVKSIIMCRRMASKSRFGEDTKMNFQVLADVQKMSTQLLQQVQLLNVVKLSLRSEKLSWKVVRTG